MSMRTNEDFKAEVYKRGIEKIQKRRRKQRKIISAMSVGVAAACFVLVIFAVSPNIINQKNEKSQLKSANSIIGNMEKPSNDKHIDLTEQNDILVVEIKSDNEKSYICQITDGVQLKKFVEIITEIEEQGLINNEQDTIKVSNSSKNEYILNLKYKGIYKEYSLKGNILFSLESKKDYEVNYKQLEELYNLIK